VVVGAVETADSAESGFPEKGSSCSLSATSRWTLGGVRHLRNEAVQRCKGRSPADYPPRQGGTSGGPL